MRRGPVARAVGAAATGVAVAAVLMAASPLGAVQRVGARIESRMLREASAHEARGELKEAEGTLRELLRLQSGSSAAVLALEQVLRLDKRLDEVLGAFDRYVAEYPSANRVWEHKVRVLAELDSLSALEMTVRNWIRAVPGSPDPFRGGAQVVGEALGPEKAAALIREGLQALGDLPVLLVELGELELAAGRPEAGASAWARAPGPDRARNDQIFGLVEDLGDRRGLVAGWIVAELGTEPATPDRLRAGAELALREDLQDDARRLAGAATAHLEDREARAFLDEFARSAEQLERHESSLWAYGRIREMTDGRAEGRAIDERLAIAALAAGDTAAALAARKRITESHGRGTPERRVAWLDELELLVGSPDADAAMEALTAFRNEYPDASDLDVLSAALASRLLGDGMPGEAMDVLSGIDGPGAAVERAFILLEGGALPEGVAALQAALPEIDPDYATEILEFTLAMSELTLAGTTLAAEIAIARHRGRPEEGVALVRDLVDSVAARDRPAILALGARAADDAGLTADAGGLRRRIVAEHADAREFPEAALRLARAIAAEPGGADEAVRILEALIVSRPDSPVVPGARRELRRIRTGNPGAGGAAGRSARRPVRGGASG